MRKSLLVLAGLATLGAGLSAAQAADLPRRKGYQAPAPVVAPVRRGFTWTGAYVGGTVGYGWGKHTKDGASTLGKPKGAAVGLTAGYNQQFGNVVAGVEGDVSRTGEVADRHITGGYSKSHLKTLTTARARIGLAADRALIYATGGYAGGAVMTKVQPDFAPGYKETKWLNGYAVGGGVEYAATDNVTVKGEYLYTDLGSKAYSGPGAPKVKAGFQDNLVRLGANYKF